MFPNKMMSRDACVQRYGHIDFASKKWPGQSKWMGMLEVPKGMFPQWKVMDTEQIVHAIFCNVDIHHPLMTALQNLHSRGMADLLKTYDGCFNIRTVRGSSAFSTHAYGLGIDINAATNPMSSVLHTNMNQEFVKCFTEVGFDWGGNFHSRKDPMHFSYAWEG